jgi:hypothetical protein
MIEGNWNLRRYERETVPFIHPDGRVLRTGKHPARFDPKTPLFKRYLAEGIAPAPAEMNWYKSVTSWTMMGNDTLGDCTIASKGHDLQVASLNAPPSAWPDGMITLTEAQAIEYYSQWDGYVPGDPSTDNGGEILTVLQDWHAQRLIGHRLLAYASIAPDDQENISKAIELFGITDVGLQLPITAQSQIGGTWDIVGDPNTDPNSAPGSWGGHDVTAAAYNATGLIFITWGALQAATWRWVKAYCDELYALILGMTFASQPTGFTGFSLDQLLADMPLVAA